MEDAFSVPFILCWYVDKVYEQLLSTQVNAFFDPILDNCLSAYSKMGCETTLLRNGKWLLTPNSEFISRQRLQLRLWLLRRKLRKRFAL